MTQRGIAVTLMIVGPAIIAVIFLYYFITDRED